jgi:hypothetical protein
MHTPLAYIPILQISPPYDEMRPQLLLLCLFVSLTGWLGACKVVDTHSTDDMGWGGDELCCMSVHGNGMHAFPCKHSYLDPLILIVS